MEAVGAAVHIEGMCGRYDNLIPRDAMAQLFGIDSLTASNFPPRYNIAPTQQVPIVRRERGGRRELLIVRWGLVPFWMKEMPRQPHINARADTVERTSLFREAFGGRRCLVPATGFYEWENRPGGKQPYRFRLKSGDPFAFAGLWESAMMEGERLMSTTIIVTDANELVGSIHSRMPVILAPEHYASWLDPETDLSVAKGLLKPYSTELMEAYPVSSLVNHHENDIEQCIEPIELDEQTEAVDAQPGLPGL